MAKHRADVPVNTIVSTYHRHPITAERGDFVADVREILEEVQ